MIKKVLIAVLSLSLLSVFAAFLWLVSALYVFGNNVSKDVNLSDLSDFKTTAEWEDARPDLIKQFEETIYGPIPTAEIDWNIEREVIDNQIYGGKATIEQIFLTDSEETIDLGLVLVTPNNSENVPLIVVSSFCANHNAWREYTDQIRKPASYPGFCDMDDSLMVRLTRPIFGDMISAYPAEQLIDKGFAVLSYYPGDVVPDSATTAPAALERLGSLVNSNVTGAVAAWAWGYGEVARVLGLDSRIDSERVVAYGHSRNAKAALLATVTSNSIAGLIAHQSGTAGSSIHVNGVGESIESITQQYGFWFDSAYVDYKGQENELPIDQHQLVALVAPKPAIYTGARWDKWSDPKGSFAAMRAANSIYKLYGDAGSTATNLVDFKPPETTSFFMRPATHGVRSTDWDAFIKFLDVHFVNNQEVN